MHVIRGADAHLQPSSLPIFSGEVETHTYVDDSIGKHLRLTLVRFSPGARTAWHRHTFEQGLIISEGLGILATEGTEHEVAPGDVVIVPAGEKHWHGATDTTPMSHISITTPGETTVLAPVVRE